MSIVRKGQKMAGILSISRFSATAQGPGWAAGDQPNTLTLVQIEATGPRQLWQREPTTWEPEEARWAAPGRAVLKLRHLDAQGEMPDTAPETYAELALPR